jgi:hypothetical protein
MISAPVFAVFVPGALAGGLLVSLGLLGADLFAKVRGDSGARRAVTTTAAVAAADVRFGHGASLQVTTGLRNRTSYALVALLAGALIALAIPGTAWNYLNPGGYISDIGWIWAVSLLVVIALGVVAAVALRLAPGFAPVLALVIGVGSIARFTIGPEDAPLDLVLGLGIPVTLMATVGAVVWARKARPGVPTWTRPLLRSTPLGQPAS